MILNCVAVDDEPLALKLIEEHCKKIEFINLKKTFLSSLEALEYLRVNPVDVILLDINMPEMNGITVSSLLNENIQIIFITAYDNYALKSYNFNTTDYILKPVSFAVLYKAFEKCLQRALLSTPIDASSNLESHIILKDNKTIYQIEINNVLFIEGMKDYAKVYLKGNGKEKIIIRESLKTLSNRLKSKGFIRVHRSFIVAINKIDSIKESILFIGNHKIPINKMSKEYILKEFNKIGIIGGRKANDPD